MSYIISHPHIIVLCSKYYIQTQQYKLNIVDLPNPFIDYLKVYI